MPVTFITGNFRKANLLAKYLGYPMQHQKLDLDELQSLDLREITEHKARQAFSAVQTPVLVEDISFVLKSLGRLPGPFIKWFLQEIGLEGVCRLADSDPDRRAITEVCYAYFDGKKIKFFEGAMTGKVPDHPKGEDGFGWNAIFIPDGQEKTNAEMDEAETRRFSLRSTTVFPQIKVFLTALDKI